MNADTQVLGKKQKKLSFLGKLGLDQVSLQRLTRITTLVNRFLPHSFSAVNVHGYKATNNEKDQFQELGPRILQTVSHLRAESLSEDNKDLPEEMAAFKLQSPALQEELEAFWLETATLFEIDDTKTSEMLLQLSQLVNQVSQGYAKQLELCDSPTHLESFQWQAELLSIAKQRIGRVLMEFCTLQEEKERLQDKNDFTVSLGVKTVANLLTGFKVKALLGTTSKTHALLNDLKLSMKTLAGTKERFVSNPELRREVFGNIKLLQERTYDLVALEKMRKRHFPMTFLARFGIAKIEVKAQEIKVLADRYYQELNFTDDEVEAFHDLSLDAHHPNRGHLKCFNDDILEGALHLASAKRSAFADPLIRTYVLDSDPALKTLLGDRASNFFNRLDQKAALQEELTRLEALYKGGSEDINKRLALLRDKSIENQNFLQQLYSEESGQIVRDVADLYLNLKKGDTTSAAWKTMESSAQENATLKGLLETFATQDAAIIRFQEKIKTLNADAFQHPDIGNGDLKEKLALNVHQWKEQQERADAAIQGIFDQLKVAYCEMEAATQGGKALEITSLALKSAAEELTKARDLVLVDKERWDVPIKRWIEIPTGPAAIARGEFSKDEIEHSMTCPNTGYPSTSFRGRQAGLECIQPNLQRVEIKDRQGQLLCEYTSSATNVEFFQIDPDERSLATLQQTGEILLGKIDNKLRAEGVGVDGNLGQTIENPLEIDVMTVLLLSPDSLREWLIKNRSVKNLVEKFNKKMKFDSSQNEKLLLEESVKAWMTFDKRDGKGELPDFDFKGKDGKMRTLHCESESAEGRIFALIDGDKTTYVKFNISCYNVGCNKWAKMMNHCAFGKSIETLAKWGIGAGRMMGLKGKLKEYGGERGIDYENFLNEQAFSKDTARYEAKLSHLVKQKDLLAQQIVANQTANPAEFELYKRIEVEVGSEKPNGLQHLRLALDQAEAAYADALQGGKSTVIKQKANERQKAFQSWQTQRQQVALMLNNELAKAEAGGDNERTKSPLADYLAIVEHTENLRDMFHEIKDQMRSKDFRSDRRMQENMYSLPSALVAFGVELDADPHTGCRSGKDRTSLQRIEIATRFGLKKIYGRHLSYREMEQMPQTHLVREQIMLNSGHIDDLARLNTGSVGLNLSGAYGSYLKNFGAGGTVYPSWYEKTVLFGVKDVFNRRLK